MGEKEGDEQTWRRVNTHVDRKIAELIEALSLFPKLQTIGSCQGGSGEWRNSWVRVSFKYGEQLNYSFTPTAWPGLSGWSSYSHATSRIKVSHMCEYSHDTRCT